MDDGILALVYGAPMAADRLADLPRVHYAVAAQDRSADGAYARSVPAMAKDAAPRRLRNQPFRLSFGFGPHYYIGAPLAKVELQAVLRHLVARLPQIRLAVDGHQHGVRGSPCEYNFL